VKISAWTAADDIERRRRVNRRKLRKLVDEVARDLDLPPDATHRDASRRVCELMSERLERPVDVRFAAITNAVCLSGATALLENGTYLVICADSPSWYHRLHVLLHEFAHVLLKHQPVALGRSEGMRKLAPHLLPRMAQIIAGRTTLTETRSARPRTSPTTCWSA
jgi:hypothetical protein